MALTVSAKDTVGKANAYASLVGPVAARVGPHATLFGFAVLVLVAMTASVFVPVATAYSYAWQRCNANGRICAPIVGATLATYTVVTADRGHQLLAIVQATSGNNNAKTFSRSLLAP